MKKRAVLVSALVALALLFILVPRLTGSTVLGLETVHTASTCFTASSLSGGSVSSGDTIELSQDVASSSGSPCVRLDVEGVTFDCKGNGVSSITSGYGIKVTKNHNTIKNCAVVNPANATLLINNSNNVTVTNNTINGTANIDNSTNVTVQNNTWGSSVVIQNAVNFVLQYNVGLNLVSCTTCTTSLITDNTYQSAGRVIVDGGSVQVLRNTWTTVGIVGSQSAGIQTSGAAHVVSDNILANGQMRTIEINSNNTVVQNNTVQNVSGTAFRITGRNNTVMDNAVFNFDGVAFDISNDENNLTNNNVTFILNSTNTSLNLGGLATPQIPEFGVGFYLRIPNNKTRIENNVVTVMNPNGLRVGVIGIDSQANNSNTSEITKYLIVNSNTIQGAKIGIRIREVWNATVEQNDVFNSTYKGIVIEAGRNHSIQRNAVLATSTTISPSLYETGVELYRTIQNQVIANTISGYHTGLFVFNSEQTNVTNVTVSNATGHGVFSFQSVDNEYNNITIRNSVSIGFKFLFTNSSTINASLIQSTLSGLELYQSYSNNITFNTQATATSGLLLDLFSADNSVNNNSFASADGLRDVVFDMFATNNNGTGNGGPAITTENGASGNSIT